MAAKFVFDQNVHGGAVRYEQALVAVETHSGMMGQRF